MAFFQLHCSNHLIFLLLLFHLSECYQWKPGPRENKKANVLVSLTPQNFPVGIKHVIADGDLPFAGSLHLIKKETPLIKCVAQQFLS
jgi:hypothetical protein